MYKVTITLNGKPTAYRLTKTEEEAKADALMLLSHFIGLEVVAEYYITKID